MTCELSPNLFPVITVISSNYNYLGPQFVVFIMWREIPGRFYALNFFYVDLSGGDFYSLFLAFYFPVMLGGLRLFPCLPTQRRQTIAKTTAYPAPRPE